MAAAEVMIEAHEVNGLQHGYVHTKAAAAPDPVSATSRTLPQSTPTSKNDKVDTSPASSKSKHSTQFSSSETSQLTNAGPQEWSPISTAFSSQEQLPVKDAEATDQSGHELPDAISQEPLQNISTRASTGSPSRADLSRDVVTDRKRTASGQSKRASISSIHDLKVESSPGRSRTSTLLSTTSNGSVMELSQQLRTRLSYAMVKVQNGWQTRSLDEVESLASQSPRSTVSGFPRNALHSPRSVMSGNLQRSWSSSDSSDDGRVAQMRAAAYGNTMQAPPQPKRGLAPPADIVPGSRRRPTPNAQTFVNGVLQSPSKSRQPGRPAPKLRTPSQTAVEEADAVETLLFMASPSNSGHHPPTFTPVESSLRSAQLVSSQMSPMRDQFDHNGHLLSPKKVAFDASGAPNGKLISRTVQIERMLDESDDEDDNDDLDHAISIACATRPIS